MSRLSLVQLGGNHLKGGFDLDDLRAALRTARSRVRLRGGAVQRLYHGPVQDLAASRVGARGLIVAA